MGCLKPFSVDHPPAGTLFPALPATPRPPSRDIAGRGFQMLDSIADWRFLVNPIVGGFTAFTMDENQIDN